jgi:hypothetical protein
VHSENEVARIDIKISGSTSAAHVDAQNAILTHLQSTAAGAYALCTPKGSWDGETRILHLNSDAVDVVEARLAEVDAAGCTVEICNLDAVADVPAPETAASEEAEAAPVAVETTSRRGRRRKF